MWWHDMKHLLRKFQVGNIQEDVERRKPSSEASAPFSALSMWFAKPNQLFRGSSHSSQDEDHGKTAVCGGAVRDTQELQSQSKALSCSVSNESEEQQSVIHSMDEESQMQLAMALSVCDPKPLEPELPGIAVTKKISQDTATSDQQAEAIAFQYWADNVVDYDSKVLDGFYDVCGIVCDPHVSQKIPSLVDLQGGGATDMTTCAVVLVSSGTDGELVALQKRAIEFAVECQLDEPSPIKNGLAQKIAALVVDKFGGPVESDVELLTLWRKYIEELQFSLASSIIPLGCLKFGLARHRALLFKVLADFVGVPCRLVKGKYYTGAEDGALNLIKDDDGSEYMIDLMGAPGAIIPPDVPSVSACLEDNFGEALSTDKNIDHKDSVTGLSNSHKQSPNAGEGTTSVLGTNAAHTEPSSSGSECSTSVLDQVPTVKGDDSKALKHIGLKYDKVAVNDSDKVNETACQSVNVSNNATADVDISVLHLAGRYLSEPTELGGSSAVPARPAAARFGHFHSHLRSPSWTEGIGSHAAREMKAKDVSMYMLDAAKEKPELAQKLHNVLLESGVVTPAPLVLFSEISPKQLQAQVKQDHTTEAKPKGETIKKPNQIPKGRNKGKPHPALAKNSCLVSKEASQHRLPTLQSVEGLGERRPLEHLPATLAAHSTSLAPASAMTASVLAAVQENLPLELLKHAPVAAASALTAAVVASSMVVAAVKSSAAVGLKLENTENYSSGIIQGDGGSKNMGSEAVRYEDINKTSSSGSTILEGSHGGAAGSGDLHFDQPRSHSKIHPDHLLDDVSEFEISWEDIIIGDRIGIGSYGEVYRGEWHGTEVAVKKFLDQDISGDALELFRSEVRLMTRMRHPNIVLFMGACTRSPNLSIITEFLPRGSLYRLMHRSGNLLDERKRLRMALDVAKGMNYLHTCTPMIVHRDLKSPNLLVDKNWVVKVCDFGLSRRKPNTFLSSKSTAGTPEWMAPEVLRNEPSNEKSDVYSFGVILWELVTLQQPWNGLNAMQVVGAVGFQNRRLDIPEDTDRNIAKIIEDCFQNDPQMRPSFAQIMSSLKPLQIPLQPPSRTPASLAGSQ